VRSVVKSNKDSLVVKLVKIGEKGKHIETAKNVSGNYKKILYWSLLSWRRKGYNDGYV